MNCDKFLKAKIIQNYGIVTTEVNGKDRNLLVHLISRIRNSIKNSVTSDLNRALHILSFLTDEIPKINQKFLDADNLLLLINSVLKQFNGKLNEKFNKEDVYNLPS